MMLSEASFSCLVEEDNEISKAGQNNELLLNLMQGKAPKDAVYRFIRNTDYVMMAEVAVQTEDTVIVVTNTDVGIDTGADIDTIDGEIKVNDIVISDVFQKLVSLSKAMVVDDDETNPNEFNQNIAFASGEYNIN